MLGLHTNKDLARVEQKWIVWKSCKNPLNRTETELLSEK